MRQLAMAAVGLAPLVIQGQDLGHLLGEQAVRGMTTRRPIGQPTGGAAGDPAVRAHLAEPQLRARRPHRPPLTDSVVEQGQQLGFGGRIDPGWDPTT